ncbi:unnamed protein product [[Actinomadura] parvosata subsp. kistnae]|uniref:hypothetical protein n=1 Tax=[Actinomadura] parvosata TaxID=1955412 RepID=UPI000D2EC836|nr:unnamed protein product [Actinomadura parvosata subsp. kistnae]
MREFDEGTDLKVKFVKKLSTSGDHETDIVYESGDLPDDVGGARGLVWCDDAISDKKCDQHYARFKSRTPVQTTGCHETGHAVGLTHGAQAEPKVANRHSSLGCMRAPYTDGPYLGGHNVAMINKTY